MHAAVYQVAYKQTSRATSAAELDVVVEAMRADPGVVSGSWMGDDTTGLTIAVFTTADEAQAAVDRFCIPPYASVTLVSAKLMEIQRSA